MEGQWWSDFLSAVLRAATPLVFCALGVLVCERAGILNIGVEGSMLAGALAAVLGAVSSGNPWAGVGVALAGLLLLNEAELEMVFGTRDPAGAGPHAFEWGVEVLAVKRGARGAVALSREGEVVSRDGFRPARFVDPVGAGDGFDAGFVYGYLNGWPLERCLVLGNLVGASATAVLGDYEGYPFRHEIETWLGVPGAGAERSRRPEETEGPGGSAGREGVFGQEG